MRLTATAACAGRLVEEQELVMAANGTYSSPAQMLPVSRPVGQNDVGIVAWLMTLRSPEYPQGRKVSIISLIWSQESASDVLFSCQLQDRCLKTG